MKLNLRIVLASQVFFGLSGPLLQAQGGWKPVDGVPGLSYKFECDTSLLPADSWSLYFRAENEEYSVYSKKYGSLEVLADSEEAHLIELPGKGCKKPRDIEVGAFNRETRKSYKVRISAEISKTETIHPPKDMSTLSAIVLGAATGLSGMSPAPQAPPPEAVPASAPPEAGENTGGGQRFPCADVNRYVRVESKSLSGPGHCQGEVHAWLTNQYNGQVECVVFYRHSGGLSPGRFVTGAPNSTMDVGYDCGAVSSVVEYACYPASERADAYGNSCTSTVHP